MKRRILLISSLFSLIYSVSSQDKPSGGEIVGSVRDQVSHQPLVGVNIVVVGTTHGAATDEKGNFKIKSLQPGTYRLQASMIGYTTLVKTDVVVTQGQKIQVLFELAETVLEIGTVTVRADYFSKPQELATSAHKLSFEEVRRSPGAAGDVSRVMYALPGVVFSTDLRNDLIVRGGSPTENLTLVDNIEIPNINHFATQGASGGPIGMVNTEFIRDVTFVTGGFPVKYGDRLSSVMEVELREGNREKLAGKLNINAAGAGLIGEGPIGSDGAWMLSARRSYLEFLLRNLNFSGITIIPNFSDLQGKAVYDLGQNDKLSLLGIGGIDKVSFENVRKENTGGGNSDLSGIDNVKNRQYQYLLGGTWKHLWGSSGYTFVTLSNNVNHYFTDIDDSLGNKTYRNESKESEYTARIDASFHLSKDHQLAFGAGAKLVDVRHEVFLKPDTSRWADRDRGTGIFPKLDYDKQIESSKLWAYLQYTRWLFSRLTITPGLRFDYFDYVDHGFTVSPRLSLRYYFTQRTSLNASVGMYFQTPAYIWLTTDERNRNLKPLRSDHYIVGIEHLIQDDVRFTLDLYRKEYKQYPVSGYIPSFILVNGGAAAGAFIAGDLRSVGTGYVTGVELFLQKKLTTNYYGTLSYSYSAARFKALDGVERPGAYDYRHVLTFIAGYKISPVWEVSLRWRYTGGAPYTPIDESLSRRYGRETLDLTKINALRYSPYHRLDVRVDYRFALGSWQGVTYIDLQNAYNRKNIYYYIWSDQDKEVLTVYQWSLLPILGLTVEL